MKTSILDLLPPNQSLRLLHLQHEVSVLEQALACITDQSSRDQIYGRIAGLIEQRRDRMVAVLQAANGGDLSQLNDRA
jgi:hypothetical protein